MAPPKDFSQDGALGAGGGGDPTQPTNSTSTFNSGPSSTYNGIPMTGAMSMSGKQPNPYYTGDIGDNVNYSSEASIKASPGVTTYAPDKNPNLDTIMMFDDGGEVPGGLGDDDGTGTGANQGPDINGALDTVKQVLSYGQKKHGLNQVAANDTTPKQIPAAPASQSESGIPATRPFPRLDPLPNSFGKRRMGETDGAQQTAQNDQQQGIPDSDGDDDGDRETA